MKTDDKQKTPQAASSSDRKTKQPKSSAAPPTTPEDPRSPAEIMVEYVPDESLFRGTDGLPYVQSNRLTLRVNSKQFEQHLGRFYWMDTKQVARPEQIRAAQNVLAARAIYDRPEKGVYVRFAAISEKRYVALYDKEDRVVEIDSEGWRLCDDPPVHFRRPSISRPLPVPARGGDLDDFWPFLNVDEVHDRSLILGWIAAVMNNAGAAPILIMTGPQGSAKSSTGKILQRFLDPNAVEGAACPTTLRDLAVTADNAALLSFDNVSYLPADVSDALCRLATGSAFPIRGMYSDDELRAFSARRPIILNGITDFATRPDLLDRAVIIRHKPLPAGARRTDQDLDEAFQAVYAKLLGVFFDRVAGGLRELPRTPRPGDMRMLDFARFAVACETASGETPLFAEAYSRNRSEGQAAALEDNVVAAAIVKFVEEHGRFEGSMTDLYARLTPQSTRPPAGWPQAANRLSALLARLAPALLQVNQVEYTVDRSGPNGRKVVILAKRVKPAEPSSGSSGSSGSSEVGTSTPESQPLFDDPDDDDDGSLKPGSRRYREQQLPD